MQQSVLETARLTLRPFAMSDAPTVQRLASAFEVADTTLNIPHPYPEGAAEQWIASHPERLAIGAMVTYAIVRRETAELMGAISLSRNQRHQSGELGYWLGTPFWNHGYTTEAATALLEYGFTVWRLHRIQARHFTRNPASGRVMQKIGMTFEGIERESIQKGERFEDVAFYSILAREWQKN